jgi:hypothetical protein
MNKAQQVTRGHKHCADGANLNEITLNERLCTLLRKRSELRNVSYRQPLCLI